MTILHITNLLSPIEIVNADKKLVESIKRFDLLIPIVVYKVSTNVYEVVDGIQRLAAAKELGWSTIQANIIDVTTEEAILLRAYNRDLSNDDILDILDVTGYSPEQLSYFVNKAASTIRTIEGEDLKHLNGNILCSIDVETTGTLPGFHDIIEIACIPLTYDLKPRKDIFPFNMKIRPGHPENVDLSAMTVHQVKMKSIIDEGLDPFTVADLFEKWFEKLGLAWNKKISPLGQNWAFDQHFVKAWLGDQLFEYLIDGRYRDTMTAALFLNDHADYHNQPYPYQKVNLQYLCSTLGIERTKSHDALDDARVTAEVYRLMVKDQQTSYHASQAKKYYDAAMKLLDTCSDAELAAKIRKELESDNDQ